MSLQSGEIKNLLNFILHVMVVVDPDLVNALQGEIGVAPDGMC